MRPTGDTSSAVLLTALILSGALGGCAGSASADFPGTGTGGSTGGYGCSTADCVPPLSTPLSLDVEIDPPTGSALATTALLDQDLIQGTQVLTFQADDQSFVTATVNASSNTPVPTSAEVLLDIPSTIPGRPDLSFQATAVVTDTGTGGISSACTAQLAVPRGVVSAGSKGTLSLIPLPPADQQSPPYSFSVELMNGQVLALTPTGQPSPLTLPLDNFDISGKLHDSVDNVPGISFVARAFQGSVQVSSAQPTAGDGSYVLVLPSAVAVSGAGVTIQLTPQGPNDPWFVFVPPISLPSAPPFGFSLGTVRMSAYTPINQYNVLVEGLADQVRVSGAQVQAKAMLGTFTPSSSSSYPGTTNFARTGMTDSNGIAAMSLLPSNSSFNYDFVVVPPAGSPYATACFLNIPIPAGATLNTPSAPPTGPLQVPQRAVMAGRVTDASSRPVANAVIAATPQSGTVAGCTSTPAAPASTTTDGNGNYSLPLDPGTKDQPVTYQLDVDPPVDSVAPRLTDVISISNATSFTHDVKLLPGALVEGVVTDSSQPPARVSSATVRLFERKCSSNPCSTPPVLRGQGITGLDGTFQIVISTQ